MRKIIAFETPDNQRFFNETEARTHERRYDFGNQIDTAVRSEPQFARLDRGLLIDYFMKHGSTIGKLADSPITPQELRGIPAGFEKAPRFGHTGGVVGDKPTTGIPSGFSGTLEDKLKGDSAMDAMADELERELNKSAS